jgi:glycosyltransferase involved in cell wall biosynthesis
MRVLHLMDHSPPRTTSYVRRVMAILRQQRALGWQTCHMTGFRHTDGRAPAPGRNTEAAAARGAASSTHFAAGSGWHFFRTPQPSSPLEGLPLLGAVGVLAKRLHEVVRLTRPDIIHAHSPVELVLAALRVGRRHGLPVVFEVHAPSARAQPGTVWSSTPGRQCGPVTLCAQRWLELWAARRADAVVTNSECLRHHLLAGGVRNASLHFIPDGVASHARSISQGRRRRQRAPSSACSEEGARLPLTGHVTLCDPPFVPGAPHSAAARAEAAGPRAVAADLDRQRHSSDEPRWWNDGGDQRPTARLSRWTGERLVMATLGAPGATPATTPDAIVLGFSAPDASPGTLAAVDTLLAAAAALRGDFPSLRLLASCPAAVCASVRKLAANHTLLKQLTMIVPSAESVGTEDTGGTGCTAGTARAGGPGGTGVSGSVKPAAPTGHPPERGPDGASGVHAHGIGRPPASPPPARSSAADAVADGARDIVRAQTHQEQRAMLHRQADILVFARPARHPAAAPPSALLAAMADACLIVAADCPTHRAVIEPGRSGMLFKAPDSAALTDALQSLLNSRLRWNAMRASARWCIDFQRDWEANGERYDHLYMGLIERRRRR